MHGIVRAGGGAAPRPRGRQGVTGRSGETLDRGHGERPTGPGVPRRRRAERRSLAPSDRPTRTARSRWASPPAAARGRRARAPARGTGVVLGWRQSSVTEPRSVAEAISATRSGSRCVAAPPSSAPSWACCLAGMPASWGRNRVCVARTSLAGSPSASAGGATSPTQCQDEPSTRRMRASTNSQVLWPGLIVRGASRRWLLALATSVVLACPPRRRRTVRSRRSRRAIWPR